MVHAKQTFGCAIAGVEIVMTNEIAFRHDLTKASFQNDRGNPVALQQREIVGS